MKGTIFEGEGSMPVQKNEHVLIALDDAMNAFSLNTFTVYTRQDVIDRLQRVDPYTTVERLNGLKVWARNYTNVHEEELPYVEIMRNTPEMLVRRVQTVEGNYESIKWKIARRECQYSRLKQRLHIVKTENTNLRIRICELEAALEQYETAAELHEEEDPTCSTAEK